MQLVTDEALLRKAGVACKRANKTLYAITRLLPKSKRDATLLIYYYLRVIDNMVDKKGLSKATRMKIIQQNRKKMDLLYKGKMPVEMDNKDMALYNFILGNPRLARRMRPQIERLLDTMTFESKNKKKPISYEELINYCYLTGGSPFIMASSMMDPGIEDSVSDKIARTFGVGSDLTHLLRDFRYDMRANEVKITREEASMFDFNNKEDLKEFARLRVHEAESFLNMGKKYIKMTPSLTLRVTLALYRWRFLSILKKIKMRKYDLMENYSKTSFKEYMASLGIFAKELSYVFYLTFSGKKR